MPHASADRPHKPAKLLNLQAGRAIAALLVVFYHIDRYYFGSPSYWRESIFGGYLQFGHAGVQFFFVLSGFVIFTAHRRDIGVPGKVGTFALKRFARIYPFYWACLAATIALFVLVPSFGLAQNRTPSAIIGSIALIGIDPLKAVIFVSWTLFHEMIFYIVFAAVILHRRAGWTVVGLWLLACLVTWRFVERPPYPLALINVLFGFGIAAAVLVRRERVPAPLLVTVLGATGFLLTGADEAFFHLLAREALDLCYGLSSAVALAGAVEVERRHRLVAHGWIVLCGEASYALYLTHMLALALGAKIFRALGMTAWLPPYVAFVALTVAAVVTGIAAHLLLEKPLLRACRTRLGLP